MYFNVTESQNISIFFFMIYVLKRLLIYDTLIFHEWVNILIVFENDFRDILNIKIIIYHKFTSETYKFSSMKNLSLVIETVNFVRKYPQVMKLQCVLFICIRY